eukprot:1469858-Amphidinium_carterae.1
MMGKMNIKLPTPTQFDGRNAQSVTNQTEETITTFSQTLHYVDIELNSFLYVAQFCHRAGIQQQNN